MDHLGFSARRKPPHIYSDAEIAELLRIRDARHVELVAEHGDKAYEKASGEEVLSSIPIDLDAKIGGMDLG